MMRLVYLRVNQAWTFLFGDAPIRIENETLFFSTKRAAIAAARRHGLRVDKKNRVHPINPSNMN